MKSILLLCAGIAILFISGCSPVVYAPVGQNVPLLRNKGEHSLTASLATTEDAGGVGLQYAGAVSSSWAVISSLYFMGAENSGDDSWGGKGNYFELGVGNFGKPGADDMFIYEIFGGVGFGGIKNSEGQGSDINVKFVKPFIQPSIGLRNRKQWLDVAFTPRLGVVHYTSYHVSTIDPYLNESARSFFNENKTSVVFEPGVTLRLGYRRFKAQIQVTTSTGIEDRDDIAVNNTYISLGLNYFAFKKQ